MTDNMEVAYDEAHWRLLDRLRGEAVSLIKPLSDRHIEAIAYGSIARGDVNERSDIDVFVPHLPAPSILEALIEEAGTNITHREIVQATPTYAAKGYIYSEERRGYSFPLVPMRPIEREFYGFAGSVNLKQLNAETRVPGVDKRLMLIDPTKTGHMESPIQGKEGTVAKKLGIGVKVVRDRVRTLKRRQRVGRTGVYIKRTLSPEESFGDIYRQLAQTKAPLRRRLRTNKK
jgi:predicted nucleotidyltransferase